MKQTHIPPGRKTSKAYLDPVSRTSEVLFGLIMVLSFTCSLSATQAERADVRDMLLGAIGCNLAWGIIDAFFYLMNLVAERGRVRLLLRRLNESPDREAAQELFESVLPEKILESYTQSDFEALRSRLLRFVADRSEKSLVGVSDLRAAFGVFALVFLSTFPVAVPFLLLEDPFTAIRISNLIALVLLFSLGYSLGTYAGRRPGVWGGIMVVIGTVLVGITIALGG